MLPFYFIKKIPPLRNKLYQMYLDRANQIVPKVAPFIKKDEQILDIGCGTGVISRIIEEKKGGVVTRVDIDYNEMCDQYPVIIYDGNNLPFIKNQFSTSLLIAVLHHSQNSSRVLDEAIRVTSGKIIVIEDVFTDLPSRIITFIGDCLINWEIHSPFYNHTTKDWIKIFKSKNLLINHLEEFNLKCIGFPFKLAVFVLTKQKKKPPD